MTDGVKEGALGEPHGRVPSGTGRLAAAKRAWRGLWAGRPAMQHAQKQAPARAEGSELATARQVLSAWRLACYFLILAVLGAPRRRPELACGAARRRSHLLLCCPPHAARRSRQGDEPRAHAPRGVAGAVGSRDCVPLQAAAAHPWRASERVRRAPRRPHGGAGGGGARPQGPAARVCAPQQRDGVRRGARLPAVRGAGAGDAAGGPPAGVRAAQPV